MEAKQDDLCLRKILIMKKDGRYTDSIQLAFTYIAKVMKETDEDRI